jgi:hypothetical protein
MKQPGFSFRNLHRTGRTTRLGAIFPAVALLLLTTLACQLSLGGPQPPPTRVPATPLPQSQDWRSILQNAKPGETVTFTLTESDLTSILASEIQSNTGGVTVKNPRVVLQNGQMIIYGQAESNQVSGNFQAVLNVNVDSQGHPSVDVVSADVGPLPVPASLRQRMTETIDQALLNAAGPASNRFRVSSIKISDGSMTITGTVQ